MRDLVLQCSGVMHAVLLPPPKQAHALKRERKNTQDNKYAVALQGAVRVGCMADLSKSVALLLASTCTTVSSF